MKLIERRWYSSAGWLLLLAPFSLLFWLISSIRRWCYRSGKIPSVHTGLPVVVVGNISVGGSGKTPVVLWLANYLLQKGLRIGVVSRGYGGNAPYYPFLLNAQATAQLVGDEPLLIYQRLSVPVVVSPDRVAGIKLLQQQHSLDLVLTDDGLQHYAMARDLEIVVIDGKRRFGNGWLMPVGPLRELPSRLNTVGLLINNGGTPEKAELAMQLQPGELVNIKTGATRALAVGERVNALAGIGAPERFFATLSQQGAKVEQAIAFADHHPFSAEDIAPLLGSTPLIMTEKDAVKCRGLVDDNCWYLPVEAKMAPEVSQYIDNWIKEHIDGPRS